MNVSDTCVYVCIILTIILVHFFTLVFQCNKKETFLSIPTSPCPLNSFIDKRNEPMCVTCSEGNVYDSVSGKCTVASLPLKRQYVKLKKITCTENTDSTKTCSKTPQCPKTTIESNGCCYEPCDTGFHIKDSKCVPIVTKNTQPITVTPLKCSKETPYLYASDMLCHDTPAPIPSTSSLVKSTSSVKSSS